ncbi:MAG TPA: MBL fold metallo-hydrolase [Longimicrobiales bacterium]
MIRTILAPNPSPMTLDGTRTFVVGRRRVAVIDPGPALGAHADAVADAIGDGVVACLLVTHGHADHVEGAPALADRLGAPIRSHAAGTLRDGDAVETDAGTLVAVATPGHAPDHFAFHWPAGRAVFCGDLMTGGMDTALVAAPEGDLTAYLASLERVRALAPRVIHPAHGPAFEDPGAAIDAYIRHRREREAQVLAALAAGAASLDGIARAVYGPDLHRALREFTRGTTAAYLEHLERAGRVRRVAGEWEAADGWTRTPNARR